MNNVDLEKKYIENRNGKVFYFSDISFPGRPTLIFIHGLSSNHTTWTGIINVLHENKYNSISVDLRGHGFSDKTKDKNLYQIPVFSEDLKKIVDKEKIEKPILVGYSFGGSISFDYAAKYPEFLGGLIVLGANHANPLEYRGLGFITRIGIWIVEQLANLLLWQERKEYHYYQHGKAAGYWDSVLDGLRTMPISVNLWLITQTVSFDFRDVIGKIKVPALLIYSGHDPFITKKEIGEVKEKLPDAKIIFSKTNSHFVGTNSQEEVTEEILEFLRNI